MGIRTIRSTWSGSMRLMIPRVRVIMMLILMLAVMPPSMWMALRSIEFQPSTSNLNMWGWEASISISGPMVATWPDVYGGRLRRTPFTMADHTVLSARRGKLYYESWSSCYHHGWMRLHLLLMLPNWKWSEINCLRSESLERRSRRTKTNFLLSTYCTLVCAVSW